MSPQSARRLSVLSVRAGAGAIVLVALALLLAGLGAVLTDAREHTDEMDGLGVAVGLVAAAVALVLGAAGVVAWWLTRLHLVAASTVLCVLGLGVALVGWAVVPTLGVVVSAPLVLGGLLVGGLGFGAALGSAR